MASIDAEDDNEESYDGAEGCQCDGACQMLSAADVLSGCTPCVRCGELTPPGSVSEAAQLVRTRLGLTVSAAATNSKARTRRFTAMADPMARRPHGGPALRRCVPAALLASFINVNGPLTPGESVPSPYPPLSPCLLRFQVLSKAAERRAHVRGAGERGPTPLHPGGSPLGGPISSASSTPRFKVCRIATPSPIPSTSSHPSLPHPSPSLPPCPSPATAPHLALSRTISSHPIPTLPHPALCPTIDLLYRHSHRPAPPARARC